MVEAARPLTTLPPENPPTTGGFATHAPRVVALDPQRDPRWESFVAGHPDGLVYHHPRWLEVIAKAYRLELLGLALEDAEGQLAGVLPLFRTHGLLRDASPRCPTPPWRVPWRVTRRRAAGS